MDTFKTIMKEQIAAMISNQSVQTLRKRISDGLLNSKQYTPSGMISAG